MRIVCHSRNPLGRNILLTRLRVLFCNALVCIVACLLCECILPGQTTIPNSDCVVIRSVKLTGELGRPKSEILEYTEAFVGHPDKQAKLKKELEQAVVQEMEHFSYAFAKVGATFARTGREESNCQVVEATLNIKSDKQYKIGNIYIVDQSLKPSSLLSTNDVRALLKFQGPIPEPDKWPKIEEKLTTSLRRQHPGASLTLQLKKNSDTATADVYVEIIQ